MTERKLSKTDMAKLMHTSRAQLNRLLDPNDGNVTLESLQRAAAGVGRKVQLQLVNWTPTQAADWRLQPFIFASFSRKTGAHFFARCSTRSAKLRF